MVGFWKVNKVGVFKGRIDVGIVRYRVIFRFDMFLGVWDKIV